MLYSIFHIPIYYRDIQVIQKKSLPQILLIKALILCLIDTL